MAADKGLSTSLALIASVYRHRVQIWFLKVAASSVSELSIVISAFNLKSFFTHSLDIFSKSFNRLHLFPYDGAIIGHLDRLLTVRTGKKAEGYSARIRTYIYTLLYASYMKEVSTSQNNDRTLIKRVSAVSAVIRLQGQRPPAVCMDADMLTFIFVAIASMSTVKNGNAGSGCLDHAVWLNCAYVRKRVCFVVKFVVDRRSTVSAGVETRVLEAVVTDVVGRDSAYLALLLAALVAFEPVFRVYSSLLETHLVVLVVFTRRVFSITRFQAEDFEAVTTLNSIRTIACDL